MKQEKLQLTGGNHKNDRRELDFYPTPPEATIALMDFLQLARTCVVWEPASGDGSMAKVIERYVDKVIASDLRPNCYGISERDFFEFGRLEVDVIITNPPFNLSEQFIKKAISEADTVAMLLKSQYWHAKKRLELFEAFPPAYVCPLTWRPDFMGGEKGGAPTMEVAWSIWQKGITDTKYRLLKKPQQETATGLFPSYP